MTRFLLAALLPALTGCQMSQQQAIAKCLELRASLGDIGVCHKHRGYVELWKPIDETFRDHTGEQWTRGIALRRWKHQ